MQFCAAHALVKSGARVRNKRPAATRNSLAPARRALRARRSKLEVARHLGLAAPKQARRPTSPDVHVDMAEEDVAAMLMTLPHAQTGRCAPNPTGYFRVPCSWRDPRRNPL